MVRGDHDRRLSFLAEAQIGQKGNGEEEHRDSTHSSLTAYSY
jgi:hypothetical protein